MRPLTELQALVDHAHATDHNGKAQADGFSNDLELISYLLGR